jgi:hypothetical protein
MSAQDVANLGMEVLNLYPGEEGMEIYNSLNFWGHSHPSFSTSPSGQDNAQVDLFRENECEFLLRGIFNQMGRAEFTYFDFNLGIEIKDVPWMPFIELPNVDANWAKEEIDKKVTFPKRKFMVKNRNGRTSEVESTILEQLIEQLSSEELGEIDMDGDVITLPDHLDSLDSLLPMD